MKTKTLIRTRTTTRGELRKAATAPTTLTPDSVNAPGNWKLLGEPASLVHFPANSSLGKNGADLVFFSKDRSHCLLIDGHATGDALSELQSSLYLGQLARFIKDGEFPIKTASLVFLLPGASALHQKLIVTFTESWRLPAAAVRKSGIKAELKQGGGSRMARNAYRYTLIIKYKEETFELALTVKVVDSATFAIAPATPVPPPLPGAKPKEAPAPAVETRPHDPNAEAAPADAKLVSNLKDLLNEIVSLRSREAWKSLGESPSLQRMSGATKIDANGADLIFLSKDRKHALLIDCHVGETGLGRSQAALHTHQLKKLLEHRLYPLKTITLVFLLPHGSKLRQPLIERFTETCMFPMPAGKGAALEAAGIKVPGDPDGDDGFRYRVTVPGLEDAAITVKIKEGPAILYKKG